MNVLKEINDLKNRFNKAQEEINDHHKAIQALQDKQKSMQGEYRVFLALGIEEGTLDKEGNAIKTTR